MEMLRNKMKEVIQHNTTLNQPTSNNRYKHYKCFQCKEFGHIVTYCPNDKKSVTKRRMEGIEATKPSVMITYLETLHFSTTCMIKETDLTSWDEICSNRQGSNNLIIPGVYYAQEVTLNILSLELLEKQGFSVGYDGNRCNLCPMFKDRKIHHFDEDKMRKMQNKNLQDYFESIASKEGMEQEIVRIKRNLYSTKVQTFNDFVTFLNLIKHDEIVSQEWDYFRNRAPSKAHTGALLESALKAEIDNGSLSIHQWKTSEHGANWTRSAVPKGKEMIDHFCVQLEDTTNYPTEPTQGHYMESQQKFYTVSSSTKIKEEHASSTSSDDF
nr:ARID DNA-binding domain-containing protein [Tanacetum cinerariifolium]